MGKKKKIKNLIILIAAMLVCVAGYFIISNINFDKEEDNSIPLYENISKEDVVSFSYDVDGTQYSFSLINDIWYSDTELSADIDQDKISSMLGILTGFKSERELEVSNDELSEYGLDSPYKTVNFRTSDGTEYKLSVGSKNINSQYYARKDDGDKVYAIDATIDTYFGYTLDDLTVKESTESAE